ncbi:MAG: glycoside hydrolase family 15 protein, partial [Acetobacteraceae bacterium]
GVPAYRLTNAHTGGRYRITKRIVTDPRHDPVLQHISLEATGDPLRVFALLAPHLVNGGAHNNAWIDVYKGRRMLFADGDGTFLALDASLPFVDCSVGFVGISDGWQILHAHRRLTDRYDHARDGNIALTAELALTPDQPIILALGFGHSPAEAAFHVRASLQRTFDNVVEEYAAEWRGWQARLRSLDRRPAQSPGGHNTYRVSTAVLRAHESPQFQGAVIASLSIPWGAIKSDDDLGGYHLVWPRDLAETAGGFLACGSTEEARRIMRYLRAIQEGDGSWPQNCWLDGSAYWGGLQLDECAFPLLLLDLAWRQGVIPRPNLVVYQTMITRAAGFILRNGPVTAQDRWEEDAGYTPFTLAVEIAALLAAADLAEELRVDGVPELLRDTADAWNEQIEDWIYVSGTSLAKETGVAGYYVRITAALDGEARAAPRELVPIRNRTGEASVLPGDELVSPDALALVRFGLRAPGDPRIRDTVTVIDRVLRSDLPQGPVWHRYNGDGYGEKANGDGFDGTGIGRPWPLLTGERAHYELAAGNRKEAEHLLGVMEACAGDGGLLPEQVWDGEPVPRRELFPGRPSGSAMPLVWAHSEHLKLLRSLADGAVFDMPPQTVRRYIKQRTTPRCHPWRPDWRSETVVAGRVLRIDLPDPATLHWSADRWETVTDTPTRDTGLGLHVVELPTAGMASGTRIAFTWRRQDTGGWVGRDYLVSVA